MIEEIPLLRSILEVQSYSRQTRPMLDRILDIVDTFDDIDETSIKVEHDNIYITKGKAQFYPCMVAHTDTVHKIVPSDQYEVVFEKGAYFAWDPTLQIQRGVGGDDKVGIYIALAALRDYPAMKVAFFRDEEIGCQGAKQADTNFFKDVRFILECDRRGNDDFVDNIAGSLMSKAFRNKIRPIIQKYGYSFCSGLMTDVDELKDSVAVSMANMSCGYWNPHSDKEYVDVEDVERCRTMVYDIISSVGEKRWDHAVRPKYSSFGTSMYNGKWSEWDDEGYGGYWERVPVHYPLHTENKGTRSTTPRSNRILDEIRKQSVGFTELNPVTIRERSDEVLSKTSGAPVVWGQFGPVYSGKAGLYSMRCQFTVNFDVTADGIRQTIGLHNEDTFILKESLCEAELDFDFGIREFESYRDAKDYLDDIIADYSIQYKSLMNPVSNLTFLVGLDDNIPF